jgi:anti-sigma factor RsiW
MSHPKELFVDYVDGTLASDATAQVEAHLEGWATGRVEVRLARMGARAAGSLLEPAAPAGLAERAVAEANRVAGERHPEVAAISSSHRRRPNAPRWAAIATAAAAIIAIALIGPKLGQAPSTVAQEGAAAGTVATTAYPRPTAVEIQHVNYTTDQLLKTTDQMRAAALEDGPGEAAADGAATLAPSASDGAAFGGQGTLTTATRLAARVPRATDCLRRAFGDPHGSHVRIILARYEGQQAYIGTYLVSPGADLPATELRIDVASVRGCDILAQTSARI